MKIEATRENRLVGSMLREARIISGLTQRELSKRLIEDGWSTATRSWLSRVESGKVALKAWDLFHVRSVLGPFFEAHFWNLFPSRDRSAPPPRRKLLKLRGTGKSGKALQDPHR